MRRRDDRRRCRRRTGTAGSRPTPPAWRACTACISRAGVPCSSDAEQQEREVEDVDGERVQRLGARGEVAHQVDAAERDDEHVEERRVLEPCAGRNRSGRLRRSRRRLARRRDRCRDRARSSPSPAGGVASHITAHDDDDLDDDRDEALPQEDRVAERDDAAGHEAAVRRRCRGSAAAARRASPSAAPRIR